MKFDKNITTEELMKVDYRYHYSDEELHRDWNSLCKTRVFKTGAQFKPGMKLCQHFCNNFWEIKNDKGLSFVDCWNNRELMNRVRLWGLEGMSQLWLSWIRRAVFLTSGLANSSFYRPHFSKQIIMMTNKRNGTLFDPCAGWGGRMLGTVSHDWNYIACEPNVDTFQNLNKIVEFIGRKENVSIHNIPVENFDFSKLKNIDVVLTSPPYFNLEVYSNDETQSYNKFNSYDTWNDNWLKPTIEKCLSVLSDDGISAWNVMKIKKHDLVESVISTHEKNGWKLFKTIGFQSPLANIRKLKNKDVTYLFKKN